MRIALYHNLPSGGAKRAVYEWVRRLVAEHTIDVYSLTTADHAFCDIRPFASKHKVYEFSTRRLLQSPLGRLNQMERWQDLGDLNKLHQKIAKEINAGEYDVFFANPCSFTFVPAILQYIEIPSVYYLHEPFGPGMERIDDRTQLSGKDWRDTIDRFDPSLTCIGIVYTISRGKACKRLANSLPTHTSLPSATRPSSDGMPLFAHWGSM